jgi:hypothetical protein
VVPLVSDELRVLIVDWYQNDWIRSRLAVDATDFGTTVGQELGATVIVFAHRVS